MDMEKFNLFQINLRKAAVPMVSDISQHTNTNNLKPKQRGSKYEKTHYILYNRMSALPFVPDRTFKCGCTAFKRK